MASVANDPNGRRRIQFVAPDESRKTIRLGKCARKTAESIARRVESLLSAKISGDSVSPETASWLASIGSALHEKLARAGLIDPRPASSMFDDLLNLYMDRADVKASTKQIRASWGERIREIIGTIPVASLDDSHAEELRNGLIERGLAGPTVGRILRFARQLYCMAAKRGMISRNPFETLAHNFREGQGKPRDYAAEHDVDRLLEVCTPAWRTLIALARYGGLRCPSEALILRWENIDLPARRMTVISPKTENQGKAWRTVPISPKLAIQLEEAWELAPSGEFVVDLPQYRSRAGNWIGCNLRTQLTRVMERAGVQNWARPFRVLRSSCITDWASRHPIHAVAAWAGHTVPVAGKHYLTVLDGDFRREAGLEQAAQNAAQQRPATTRDKVNGGSDQNEETLAIVGISVAQHRCENARNYPARIRT